MRIIRKTVAIMLVLVLIVFDKKFRSLVFSTNKDVVQARGTNLAVMRRG